jgi:hypothetical protein
MPDFGIGETIAAFGGADVLGDIGLGGLFGDAAAGGGAAAAAGTGALSGAGAADLLAPSGAGLFGGTTGLAGTELAAGAGTDLAALTATGGLSAAGTAADFLAAPSASGFNAAALTPGFGDLGGAVAPTGVGGTDVFGAPPSTPGASGVANINPTGTGTNLLGGTGGAGGAGGVAAPSGVAGAPDATAAAAGGAPTAGAAPTTAAPTSGIDQLLSKAGNALSPTNLAGSAIDSLVKNPLGIAAGLGGLGYTIYEGQKNTANEASQTAAAQQAGNAATALEGQGSQLTSYLTNGTLPPQYQTQITQALDSAIANAKSNAAQQGQSTDPTQNTALAAQIQEIQNQQPILQEQLAQQLATTGTALISDATTNLGISGNLYQSLVQNDTTQAANAGKAIAALAAAFNSKGQVSGSGSGGTTVTIG